jgi:hypothetical protein
MHDCYANTKMDCIVVSFMIIAAWFFFFKAHAAKMEGEGAERFISFSADAAMARLEQPSA